MRVRTLLIIGAILAALTTTAAADPLPSGAGDFSRGYGMDGDSFDNPINPSTRDANGNRVIINGQLENGTLSGGLMDNGFGAGSSQAIGNQLNVVTQGNWNTVIIDSTQINNGNVDADSHGGK
jgi:holdfast attachment protein HfaA